ncbi:MAG: Clp protease ClpP [Alistipes sp.]|nr:Clp protease ClpP [Alistipes sp.]
MNQTIKIKNEVDTTIIDIEGTIGVPESWQCDDPDTRVTTYERFKESVSRIADISNSTIRVNIRSTGGDVNDALLIYEALKATGAKITTCCYGYTASAATIVAQAASEGCRLIAPTSLYLVHNSLCAVEGNAEEIQAEVDMLRQTDRRIAEVYASRSGRSAEEFLTLMAENCGRGRWLSPVEAIAEGLVDAIENEQTHSSPEHQTFTERAKSGVMALLRAVGIELGDDKPEPIEDINVRALHTVSNAADTSKVAFEEAQRGVEATTLKPVEDPSPMEHCSEPRKQAYESDARSIKRLFN